MTSIPELNEAIKNLQNEIDSTKHEFILMTEINRMIEKEYDSMKKEYADLKADIIKQTVALTELRSEIQKERAELLKLKNQSQELKTEPKGKSFSPYPLRSLPNPLKVKNPDRLKPLSK